MDKMLFEILQKRDSQLELFQTDLRHSLWFWTATVVSAVNAGAFVVDLIALHVLRSRCVLLICVLLLLVLGLVGSLSAYRAVRSLEIDWSQLERDSALARALLIVARYIELIPFALNFVVFMLAFFAYAG
jgi:hypothetical protein